MVGVTSRSEWVVVGLRPGTFWPAEETRVPYRGQELLLRPQTPRVAPDVAFDFAGRMTFNQALLLVRQFLSAVCWAWDSGIEEIGVTGGTHAIHIGNESNVSLKRSPFTPQFRLDYIPECQEPKALLALAFYREALNVNTGTYKFLGFFKILNILYKSQQDQAVWLNKVLEQVEHPVARTRLLELKTSISDIGNYLVYSGRCAVAHAYAQPLVNPENPDDTERLARDLPLIRALAQHFIESELGVKSLRTIWREHLYELEGFRALLGDGLVLRLRAREAVAPSEFPALPRISIRLRDQAPFTALENLKAEVLGPSSDGRVFLRGTGDAERVRVVLGLNFGEERLELDPIHGIQNHDDGSPEALREAVDVVRFTKGLYLNGALDVWDADQNRRLGRCDPFIPESIDFAATVEKLDRIVDGLLAGAEARESQAK